MRRFINHAPVSLDTNETEAEESRLKNKKLVRFANGERVLA